MEPYIWVHFYFPKGLIGHISSWCGHSRFGHVTFEIGPGALYEIPICGKTRWIPAWKYKQLRPPDRTLQIKAPFAEEFSNDTQGLIHWKHEWFKTVLNFLKGKPPVNSKNCLTATLVALEACMGRPLDSTVETVDDLYIALLKGGFMVWY